MRWLLVFVLMLAMAPFHVAHAGDEDEDDDDYGERLKVGDAALELEGAVRITSARDFKAYRLRSARSKRWVVVVFGAAWAGDFFSKYGPVLDRFANEKRYAGKLEAVAVMIDEDRENVVKAASALKLKRVQVVHLAGETGTGLVGRYVNDSLPTTFIIDPKGIVRAILPRWGKDTEKKLGAELEKLVTAGSKT